MIALRKPVVLRHGQRSLRLWPASLAIAATLGLALALLALWSLGQGRTALPTPVLLGLLGLGDTPATAAQALVIEVFRAPRICLAICCGGMLALAGATMQDLVRNGLADPGLLGVREGAALAIIALMLFAPRAALESQAAAGAIGGLASGALILALGRRASGLRFVLIGLALSWLLSALLAILLTLASSADLERATLWLAGNLQTAGWGEVALAAGCLFAGLAVLFVLAPSQAVEALGPALATSLGASRRRTQPARFAIAIVLVAAAVAVGGSFGFVGLIAPHLARALPGAASIRGRLANTALLGALLVLAADTIGRLAFGTVEIPAGVVLTAIGGPTMVVLMWQRRHML